MNALKGSAALERPLERRERPRMSLPGFELILGVIPIVALILLVKLRPAERSRKWHG